MVTIMITADHSSCYLIFLGLPLFNKAQIHCHYPNTEKTGARGLALSMKDSFVSLFPGGNRLLKKHFWGKIKLESDM